MTASPTSLDEAADSAGRMDRGMLRCFIAIRTVHLAQGFIMLLAAPRAYRARRRAAALLCGMTLESAWVVNRSMRRGSLDANDALADAGAGIIGMIVLADCTDRAARTTSVNWMLPYSVGGCVALGVGRPTKLGPVAVATLSATYAATVSNSITQGGDGAAAAIANAASFAGFYAVARVVGSFLRRNAEELDRARDDAVDRGERLARERERNRQHRMLHDSALQVLEAIGNNWLAPELVQSRARQAALLVRQTLRGEEIGSGEGCRAAFEELAASFADRGITVELVVGAIVLEPSRDLRVALQEGAREALTNVAKHSGASRAVVNLSVDDGVARVIVRDHGSGFDAEHASFGFGLTNSVISRMKEAGGGADIWSEEQRGTRVELWAPT